MQLRNIVAIVLAVPLLAWPGSAGADSKNARSVKRTVPSSAKLDSSRVSPATRRAYADFWKKRPGVKGRRLQARLARLEARAQKGSVRKELKELRRSHPELFALSAKLESEPWIVSSNGGTTALSCLGIGWIGKNGKLRCIGKLTVG